jgi:hypothetical protein
VSDLSFYATASQVLPVLLIALAVQRAGNPARSDAKHKAASKLLR